MGKRKLNGNKREQGRRKLQQARLSSPGVPTVPLVRAEPQGAATVPMSLVSHGELPPEDVSYAPTQELAVVASGDSGPATRPLTLVEMLAQEPEHAVIFHPCEGCGKPIRGGATHCEQCSTGLEEAEALSREEKVRHEQRMRRVRRGLVVTVLVTVFGTYFWFNDPRKLLDGVLPGIFGPSPETVAEEIAYAGVLPSPTLTVAQPLASTTSVQVSQNLQAPGLTVFPATATPLPTSVIAPLTTTPAPTASPGPGDAIAPALAIPDDATPVTVTPQREDVAAVPSATPTPAATRPQPAPTRTSRAASTPASTPTTPRSSPGAGTTTTPPTRTRTPLPAPTRTPVPPSPTIVPTAVSTVAPTVAPASPTAAAPTATDTALPLLPTLTPALPTVTPVLPTLTVPLPTVSVVPTEVRLPEPTVPGVPTAEVPPLPTLPLPTEVVPTDVVPTTPPGVVPTVGPPTVPVPTTGAPTASVPTASVPTAEVPTVQASAVPTDLPVVATATAVVGQGVVPTVTVPVQP